MKPRHGIRSTALVHCTALLAVCLLVGSRLTSLTPARPPLQPAGPAAVAPADHHRVASLVRPPMPLYVQANVHALQLCLPSDASGCPPRAADSQR